MNAYKSLVFIFLLATFIFSVRYVSLHVASTSRNKSFLDDRETLDILFHSPSKPSARRYGVGKPNKCTMETCFDASKCLSGFKVYVYPSKTTDKVSSTYRTVLDVIRNSSYYTQDPTRACLFVPNLDTLDRDPKSREFVWAIGRKIKSLSHWNHGTNHLIFNLFSGKYPNYEENLFFDTGQAILARASASVHTYRTGFDVSFPLLHPQHTELGKTFGVLTDNGKLLPLKRNYLLVFKGKRYVSGYGSETRNNLFRIDNDKDILMLTTCRHMGGPKEDDERCDIDNQRYPL